MVIVNLLEIARLFDELDFKSMLAVLLAFTQDPSIEKYKQQLAKETGLSKPAAGKAVDSLFKQGLISSRQVGRTVLYKLETENPLVRQWRTLFTVSILYSIFRDFEGSEVSLFGSHARGEETKESDIDLLFVGNAPRDQVRKACDSLEEKTGRKVSPVVYSRQEFSMLAQNEKNRAFYENLIRNSIKVNRWI